MKIWKKILLGFISVVFIMMIVDFSALQNDIDIIRKVDDLEISIRVELSQSNKLAYTLQQINLNQRELFLEIEDPGKARDAAESIRIIKKNIPQLRESVHALHKAAQTEYNLSEEEKAIEREGNDLLMVDSLIRMTNDFIISVQNVRRLQDEKKYRQAEALYESDTAPASRRIQKLTDVFVSNAEEEVKWAVKELNEQVDQAVHLGIYLTILSIFLALSIGYYISRSISGPLDKLIEGTNQIRKGNLKANVKLNTRGELKQLADSFNSMVEELRIEISSSDELNKELVESNHSKDTFFSIIAHDLKNPFSAILGLADLLTNQYNDFDEEERKEFIDEINNSSKIVYELLNNLLTWARSQSGKIQLKKEILDLRLIAEKSIASYMANAMQKNIGIVNEIPESVAVYADQYTLSVIIENVLNNAIKFTPDDGRIVFSAKAGPGSVEISIQDSGVGMSKEILDRLLAPAGLPTSPGTNNETGTGLGIILIKEFIDKNGGTFYVESTPGTGTDFRFTLPVHA